MKPRVAILLSGVAGVLLQTTGCGTVCDHLVDTIPPVVYRPVPYGGVRHDLDSLGGTAETIAINHSSGSTIAESAIIGTLLIADLPLSALADTILLPLTLRNALRAPPDERPSERKTEESHSVARPDQR